MVTGKILGNLLEQTAELDRRLADFEKNPHAGIPLEQVKAEMHQRFGW